MRRRVDVVREPESTCLGAGMLAAAAVGIHKSIPAAKAMSGTARKFKPDPTVGGIYDQLYEVYREIYPALRPLFAALNAAQASSS
jgi:xylulokinase